jgi:hypothetical protein
MGPKDYLKFMIFEHARLINTDGDERDFAKEVDARRCQVIRLI